MAVRIELVSSIATIDAGAWDALAGESDPFAEHAFLHSLEASGSVGREAGCAPLHVAVHDGSGLLAALPLYVKAHSFGEYIFDFAWARAAERAGIAYYPKLVSMAPFTPATGTRVLRRPGVALAEVVPFLVEGLREAQARTGASSTHVLFLTEDERAAFAAHDDFMPRLSFQFHWHNAGYGSFDEYLARFRSALRKQVRKERREVASHGLELRVLQGPELVRRDWDALTAFYLDTCHKRGSGPYLNRAFFRELEQRFAHRVVAVLAYRNGKPIAGTLNFQKGLHLYGRYWGALEDLPSLHFECCYYLLIERAIEQRLTRFEAGAQGEHKLRRGLLPSPIHSVHAVADPALRAAIADFLPREAMAVQREMAMLAEHGPFHRDDAP